MPNQKPDDDNVNMVAAFEGIIAAIAFTMWIKKHWTINAGWYWIMGVVTVATYVILFDRSRIFRIAAMVIVTSFVAFLAYAIGTGIVGYPIGILAALAVCAVSIVLHLSRPMKNGEPPVIRGTAFNTFEAAKSRSAALLSRSKERKDSSGN